VLNKEKPQMGGTSRVCYFINHFYEVNKMSNNHKTLTLPCQITIQLSMLNKSKIFDIDTLAANDKLTSELIYKLKYYSIRDIMKILNISTTKEVEYLIKKLELEQSKYRHLNYYNEWCYNESAITSLKLYLKYKAA
jgi:hypothetical protein